MVDLLIAETLSVGFFWLVTYIITVIFYGCMGMYPANKLPLKDILVKSLVFPSVVVFLSEALYWLIQLITYLLK